MFLGFNSSVSFNGNFLLSPYTELEEHITFFLISCLAKLIIKKTIYIGFNIFLGLIKEYLTPACAAK